MPYFCLTGDTGVLARYTEFVSPISKADLNGVVQDGFDWNTVFVLVVGMI